MLRTKTRFAVLLVMLTLASSFSAPAFTDKEGATQHKHAERRAKIGSAPAILWVDPVDIKSRDLFYGRGSKEHLPGDKLRFIGEKLNGINPKFDVRDRDGVRWGVKMGAEAKPETAASRLVWAVGYFTNEDYYVLELNVKGLPTLTRGEGLIKQGKIRGVRMKRHNKGEHKIGLWKWNDKTFAGTRELNGLKVMMELINNTDLKPEHLVIYDIGGTEQRYYITDLGGSFGRAGAHFYNRTKGVLKDFQSYPLIQKAGPEYLDFWYFKHVPRADAKWIGGILDQLSDAQISDAFRAAGFSPEEVEGFTGKVREKIKELTSL
ncbi:MAG: hypothetical protein LAP21_12820 [Acidobacteriia bacterium]|nr:hypothetical protein [Terriglobia bacterium]